MTSADILKAIRYVCILVVAVGVVNFIFNELLFHPMPFNFRFPPHLTQTLLWMLLAGGVIVFYLARKKEVPAPGRVESEMTGIINNVLVNEHQDVDGLEIESNGQIFKVKFPPHCAAAILATAARHDSVHFVGRTAKEHNEYRLVSLSNLKSNQSVEVERLRPPAPSEGKVAEITITHPRVALNSNNDATGLISGDILVEIKPHVMKTILPLIQNDATIIVKGIERTSSEGFVNVGHHRIIHAISVEVNNKTYIVR